MTEKEIFSEAKNFITKLPNHQIIKLPTMFNFFKKLFSSTKTDSTTENDNTVKYLIVGLGNIGMEYQNTRHNIGFDVVDYLAAQFDVSYKSDRYAFVGSFKDKGRTFVLVKPTTYMNLSGQAVRYWMQKEKIELANTLVILDDLNIDFGQVKMKGQGSAGGHNGLKNIEEVLATQQYPRLRVGIGNKFSKGRQVDFVLGRWNKDEESKLPAIIEHCAKGILNFGHLGLEKSMNLANQKIEL